MAIAMRIIITLLSACVAVKGFSYELSLFIGPGEVECFYQHMHVQQSILEIDYQVGCSSNALSTRFQHIKEGLAFGFLR